MKISATIITLNEERNLPRAIESLRCADEILVVDSGSTDRTVEIASKLGARVVESAWPGYANQKNHAAEQASYDWILSLDADESLSEALEAEIWRLKKTGPQCDGYTMPRMAQYLGRWILHSGWYPDRKLRLYDRRKATWVGAFVHETVRVSGRIGHLESNLLHFTCGSLSEHLRTMDRYTTLAAEQLLASGERPTWTRLIFTPPWTFFQTYFLKLGFLDGVEGLAIANMAACYNFVKFAKARFMSNGILRRACGGRMFEAIAFLAGLLIGSFLNVCIYRMPRDISVVRPRSHCPHCLRTIAWYDNIPVLSFLLLRARCRHCLTVIPVSYALVELSTGLAFLLSAYALGPTLAAAKGAVFSAIVIALIVTDFLDRILPDELTLGGTLIGLAFAPFINSEPGLMIMLFWKRLSQPWLRLADAAFAAAACAGLIWFVGWAYQKVRHREGMGFGDVKMLAMIGAFLGLRDAFLVIIVGSLIGAVLGLGFLLIRKKGLTYELPFGSFLGIAALGVAIWGEALAAWYGRLGR